MNLEPCKCCIKNDLTYFIDLINRDDGVRKIIEARYDALKNNKISRCEFKLPMFMGSHGKAVYTFDGPAIIDGEK